MDIKTGKQKNIIRSRYVIHNQVFTDVFYGLFDGFDSQLEQDVIILSVHNQLVSPEFVDFLVDRLTDYLYLNISGLFELSDYEFNGEEFYIIYKVTADKLVTLDLYLNQIREASDYSTQAYKIVHDILLTLYALEQQNFVFGSLNLNNVFITEKGDVLLGPAMLNLICLEFYMSKADLYDESIFLAPEFIKSFEYSTQTDVYSFGMLAFYIYTHRWPYDHGGSIMKLKQLFQSGPIEPKSLNNKMSDQLNYFVLKSIQLNAVERWGTFRLLIQLLEGRDDSNFERLSNQFVDDEMFELDIVHDKRKKMGKILNVCLVIVGIVGAILLGTMVYSSYFLQYEVVMVPYVESKEVNQAIFDLKQLELDPKVAQYNYHPTVAKNTVIRVDPPSGRSIKQGRSVLLYISKGKQELQVPSLIGKHLHEINIILGNTNIEIETVDSDYSFIYEKGMVVSQVPQPDQYVFDYGVIQVSLSKGVPITFDVIEIVDDDYIKVMLTFDLVEKGDMQHIEIFNSVNDNKNILYSDYHYFGDTVQKHFIVHKSAEISLYKDSELLIKKQFTDDDYVDKL